MALAIWECLKKSNDMNIPKQPQKPTQEKKAFNAKLDRLKGIEFDSLQEFMKALDALN